MIVPLTVRTAAGPIDVQVRADGPTAWSEVHPLVLKAAGLPPGTPLHMGPGEVEPCWMVGAPPLLAGAALGTVPASAIPDRPLLVLAVVAGPDAGRQVPLPVRTVLVGRDPDAGLTLTDPQVSFRHATLEPTSTGLAVRDLGSTNGVLVDGHPTPAGPGGARGRTPDPPGVRAVTGSLIRVGGTVLQIQLTAEPAAARTADGYGHLVRQACARTPDPLAPPIPEDPGDPPQRQRRPLPLVAAVLGAGVGAGLALVLGSPAYLAFAALGPVTMLGTAAADRVGGRRSFRKQLAAHRAAVATRAAAIAVAADAYRAWAWDRWPDPATLLRRAEAASGRLWDRRVGEDGYLQVCLGVRAGAELPVTIDLAAAGVLGLAGASGRATARWLLAQLAALHSPGDLTIAVIDGQVDLRPCHLLPHAVAPPPCTAASSPGRAPGAPGIAALIRPGTHDLVAVLDGADAVASAVGADLLAAARRGPDPPASPRVHVLCLAEQARRLPPGCVDPTARTGGRIDVSGVDADLLEATCRAVAPLRESGTRGSPDPPASLSLPELVGPVTADTVRRRWGAGSPVAVLGATSDGTATFDVAADGPHLLVAGTTGSGKSELLLTLIASLAIACPPSAVTFLLIDYKGGAAFAAVADLPHVVGTVTDLDPALSARALASLRAELHRRERRSGTAAAPPPRLVIVIDEFATLAAELPEFLSGLLDVAQRGRSLGLHLVLATQRPAGVVSPAMRSNIAARICLRVTDTADSIDVIDAPDAARIAPATPGRALLRTGAGLTTFQTALTTAPTEPALAVRRLAPAPPPAAPPDRHAGPSALRQIVAAVTAAAAGLPAPHRPWLPPLPARYLPTGAHVGDLALADLPEEQARRGLPPPETSILVTGPSGSGRSTALRRIAALAARRGAELLVIDATGGLADLRSWPAVSSYLTLAEPLLVVRLAALLADPSRRPPAGRVRWLLVDGFDLAAAALDRADYVTGAAALTEAASRAAGTLRLAVAGPPALAHHRQVGGLPAVIELGDATGAGVTTPGRGRWAGRTVQIADAPAGCGPADAGTGAPPISGRLVVRPLPDLVTERELPAPRPGAVPLGLGGDDAEPLTVDLAGAGGAIVIAGRRRSGVTTAVRLLAAGAARAGIPVLRVLAAPGIPGVPGVSAGSPGPAGIIDLDVRAGPEPLRAALAAHRGPLLLVADRAGCDPAHPAAEMLERFCHVCGTGQHLLLGERTDAVARAHSGPLRAALSFRRGLLLAPDAGDGTLLDVSLPRRTGPVPPGRGFWAEAGWAAPVQVACPVEHAL